MQIIIFKVISLIQNTCTHIFVISKGSTLIGSKGNTKITEALTSWKLSIKDNFINGATYESQADHRWHQQSVS